jgi:hypothetical protein
MNLFNLVAKLTLDDKDYQKGIDGNTKKGVNFGQKIATGAKVAGKALAAMYTAVIAVGAALTKLTLNAIDLGGEIDDESQKLNMSTGAYQKWALAMKMSGTTIDTMSMGMKTFTGVLDDASNGSATALLMLERLGMGYEDFAGLSVEDSFKKVVEQFQGMEEGAAKTQLAVDLFGRSGQELLPLFNQEVGWLDTMFQKYEDLGLILDEQAIKKSAEFGDQIDLLVSKFKMTATIVSTAFMPAVMGIVNGLMAMAQGSEDGGEKLKDGILNALNMIIEFVPKYAEFAVSFIETIYNVLIEAAPKLIEAAFALIMTLIGALERLTPKIIPLAMTLIRTLVKGIIDNLDRIFDAALYIILELVDGILAALPELIQLAVEIIVKLVEFIGRATPKLLDAAVYIIDALVKFLLLPETIAMLIQAGIDILFALIKGQIQAVPMLLDFIMNLISTLINTFKNTDWQAVGKNILDGIVNGVKNGVKGAVDAVKKAAKDIFNGVKDFFGIKSPSKLMQDEVGKFLPEGIASGFEKQMPKSARDIKNSVKDNPLTEDLVNGFSGAMRINNMSGKSENKNTVVQVFIGNTEIKDFVIKTVEQKLKQRGMRNLNEIGAFGK